MTNSLVVRDSSKWTIITLLSSSRLYTIYRLFPFFLIIQNLWNELESSCTLVSSFLLIMVHTFLYIVESILNKYSTYSTCTTLDISIAEKNSFLNWFSPKLLNMKVSFCYAINQYICILSSAYRNSELWFLSIFYFFSNEYYSFGINLGSCFSSSVISFRGFFCIFWMILSLLERVPKTSFTSSIIGLYFFAKQAMLFFYEYLFSSFSTASTG